MDCEESDIRDITPVKFGMTNLSFRFSCNGEWYIYRHPGPGTEKYINRRSEAASMVVAKKMGLDDTFIYMDPEMGWKLSRFVDDAVQLDYNNKEQVEKALQGLRRLHTSGEKTNFSFDIWAEIEGFRKALGETGRHDYPDFNELAEMIDEIHGVLKITKASCCLCHADSYSPNFLFDVNGRMYLIDWEYSGMADPAVDIGTFVTCSDYRCEELVEILKLYFGRVPSNSELLHFTGYTAICSYYWYLWALYQESNGKSIDQYMYIWYQHTKLYGSSFFKILNKGE